METLSHSSAAFQEGIYPSFEALQLSHYDEPEMIRPDQKKLLEAMKRAGAKREAFHRIESMCMAAGLQGLGNFRFVTNLVNDLFEATPDTLDALAAKWRGAFEHEGLTRKIDSLLMNRNYWVANLLADRIPSQAGNILDHDCGDSYVANFLQGARPDLTVYTQDSADVRREIQHLPFEAYDYGNKRLAYRDGTFDSSLMITVLHHCDEPDRMFDEVARVTRPGGQLYLLENTFEQGDLREQALNVFFDWFFNNILHDTPLPLPYSHRSEDHWERFFVSRGLKQQTKMCLGQHVAIPLNHTLYILQKPF